MNNKDNYKTCMECGITVERNNFVLIGYDYYCYRCSKKFEQEELIEQDFISKYVGGNRYEVTEKGIVKFPQWKRVAYCENDGATIYQKTVDAQITNGIKPCCPFCRRKINND